MNCVCKIPSVPKMYLEQIKLQRYCHVTATVVLQPIQYSSVYV